MKLDPEQSMGFAVDLLKTIGYNDERRELERWVSLDRTGYRPSEVRKIAQMVGKTDKALGFIVAMMTLQNLGREVSHMTKVWGGEA